MENTHAPEDEIDLLDLLVIIAENIKLLVLGPLVAGLLALGLSFALPSTFESQAIINANNQGVDPSMLVTMATSPVVLESVRQQIGFEPDLTKERALDELRDSIKVSLGRLDKLVTITVSAPSAELAQRTNQALLAELFNNFRPSGADLERLSVRLQFEKEALSKLMSLEEELVAIIKSGKESDLLSSTYVNVTTMKGSHFAEIQSLEARIQGLTQNALVQSATFPETPLREKNVLAVSITSLAAGFALLLLVFFRQALVNSAANPESAAKMARIKNSFRTRL